MDNLINAIDKIVEGQVFKIVISNKKDAYALTRATNHGIASECISPKDFEERDEFNRALVDRINSYGVDLIVLAGYLVILPEILVKEYPNRIINIHPSLIPSFCGPGMYGLKVHEAVLKRGVKVTGATVHYVDAGVDSGPILLQKAIEVEQGDTAEVLQKRVMEQAEWLILPQAIDLIANGKVEIIDNKAVII